jgi:hypothetical protein
MHTILKGSYWFIKPSFQCKSNEPKLILKHDLSILSYTLAKKIRHQRGPATMVPEAGARLRFAPGGRFVPF